MYISLEVKHIPMYAPWRLASCTLYIFILLLFCISTYKYVQYYYIDGYC